jgi:hypothetical protein
MAAGWAAGASLLDTENLDANNPAVRADAGGNCTAVWHQSVGSITNIYAKRYDALAGNWQAGDSILLDTDDTGNAQMPHLSTDPRGDVMVVWHQIKNSVYHIMSRLYIAGAGWEPADHLVESNVASHSTWPVIDMDENGNALVVYNQYDGSFWNLWANRYVFGQGWGQSVLIETYNTGNAEWHWLAVNGKGTGFVTWRMYDGVRIRAWANQFESPDVTPPGVTLSTPTNGATTIVPVITVSGTTEAGSQVSVNGVLAAVNSSTGAFSLNIPLLDGSNIVTVVATDAAGNSAEVTRTVTFNNPIPGLQAQVAQIVSNLATVWSKLNDTNTTVGTIWDQLNTTQTSLTALQAQVSTLRTELTTTHAGLNSTQTQVTAALRDIDSLQATVDALQTQLNTTKNALTSTQTDLTGVQDDIDGKAESSSPMIWATIAIIVSVIAAIAADTVLRKKKT